MGAHENIRLKPLVRLYEHNPILIWHDVPYRVNLSLYKAGYL